MLLQLYTVSQKEDTKLMALTRQILTDFTSSFIFADSPGNLQ